MPKYEPGDAVADLAAAFRVDVDAEMAKIWNDHLCNFDGSTLRNAVKRYIGEGEFFPAVAVFVRYCQACRTSEPDHPPKTITILTTECSPGVNKHGSCPGVIVQGNLTYRCVCRCGHVKTNKPPAMKPREVAAKVKDFVDNKSRLTGEIGPDDDPPEPTYVQSDEDVEEF